MSCVYIPLTRLTKQLVNFITTDVTVSMKLPEYLLCYPGESGVCVCVCVCVCVQARSQGPKWGVLSLTKRTVMH